jgi:Rieske Fe-S protein
LLHLRCAPYRSYAVAVELNGDNYPDHLIYDLYDPYHYFRTQEVMGKRYLIVGGEDHKTAHEENTTACLLNLEAYVRRYYDVKSVPFKWSSQYYEPADGLPYIGHMPGSPNGNIYVATGFSGNGMTWSHVSALVLHSMLTGVESSYIDLFAPGRIKPVAGFTNFVKENVDVAKELVKGYFTREKIESLSELARGEGKVISYEGEKIALFKDEGGQLHAVSPICTHMKCNVAWNTAEQSWDCPCHGARYDCDGNVITGPASKGLAKIDLEEVVEK